MDKLIEDLESEIKCIETLRKSWQSEYRSNYLDGKIYICKKIIEQIKGGKYKEPNE